MFVLIAMYSTGRILQSKLQGARHYYLSHGHSIVNRVYNPSAVIYA